MCAQLLSIFRKSYSEFATNAQRTASALGVYRAHTQRVHCVNVKNSKTYAHILVVFGRGSGSRKPRLSSLTHSFSSKDNEVEPFVVMVKETAVLEDNITVVDVIASHMKKIPRLNELVSLYTLLADFWGRSGSYLIEHLGGGHTH